jgi:NTE family protein
VIGLVLAGGGAKGAYQAGAVQLLAERGFAPDLIAGTSIGALNAAVLLSEPTFREGARRLTETWDELGRSEVVRPSVSGAVGLIALAGLLAVVPTMAAIGLTRRLSLLDPAPIERLVRRAVDPARVRSSSIEAWVAIFPSLRLPLIDAGLAGDLLARWAGAGVEWRRLQDLAGDGQVFELLLASAALPIAFPRRKLGGRHYIDGGLADNAPLGALVRRGCTAAVVIHLDNAGTWDRRAERHAGLPIVEIRPRRPIQASEAPAVGRVAALLDFTAARLDELRRRGYEDARATVEPIVEKLGALRDLRSTGRRLAESTQRLELDPPLDEPAAAIPDAPSGMK